MSEPTAEVPSREGSSQRQGEAKKTTSLTREEAVARLKSGDKHPDEEHRAIVDRKTGRVFIVAESVPTTREGGKTPREHSDYVATLVRLGEIGDAQDAAGAYCMVVRGELDYAGESRRFPGATLDEFEDAVDKGKIDLIPQDIGLEPEQAQ